MIKHGSLVILKLSITFFLATIFGLERQKSHKMVGFGTFIFVSLGACALGTIAVSEFMQNSVSLLAAIVTGIGFLGAGALIKGTDRVAGFTTAASIWVFAIFGLSVGVGQYLIAGLLYILIWVVIVLDLRLEARGVGSYQRKISLSTNRLITEKEIHNYLLTYTKKNKLISVNVNKETHELHLTYLVDGSSEKMNRMVQSLYKEEWFKSCHVE